MRRACTLVSLFVVALSLVTIGAARAGSSDETQLAQLVNAARSSAGLGPLTVASDLTAIAEQRAADMAAQGRIFHQSLSSIDGQRVGENVGMASTIDNVNQLFLNSGPHYANYVGDDTEIGIGVVWSDGQAYVNQIFRLPWSSAPAAAPVEPAPAPEPVVAPAPEPEPPAAPESAPAAPAEVAASADPVPAPAPTTAPAATDPGSAVGSHLSAAPIAHDGTGSVSWGRPAAAPASAPEHLPTGPALAAAMLLSLVLGAHIKRFVTAARA
jgi:hypothetical protein